MIAKHRLAHLIQFAITRHSRGNHEYGHFLLEALSLWEMCFIDKCLKYRSNFKCKLKFVLGGCILDFSYHASVLYL